MSASKPDFPYIRRSFDEDIEQYSHSLRQFSPTIKQLSKGSFRGHSTHISLLDFTLIRRIASAGYSSRCWVPHQATFIFPLSPREIYARGGVFGPTRQNGSLGNHEAYVIVPENFEYLILTLPLTSLVRYLDANECDLFLQTLAVLENAPVDAQMKRLATVRLLNLVQAVENANEPLSPALMEQYCQQLVHILFSYLAYHKYPEAIKASNHERILQRTLQLIEGNPTRLFTLQELAHEVYASKRAVQYAFASITGLPPMRFQKLLKLNLIRRELKAAQAPARFAAIAARYSFSNAGRLCREYKELFGESPKDTLRQAPPAQN